MGKFVQELTRDFRKIMEPYTATNIKVRPKNVVKDFVHVAGLLNVSHFCAFTKTELGSLTVTNPEVATWKLAVDSVGLD